MRRSLIDTDHAFIKELVNRFGLVLDALTAGATSRLGGHLLFQRSLLPSV